METCNKKKLIIIIKVTLIFLFNNLSLAETNFETLENKKVSYVDFFLLKYENKLMSRAQVLRAQLFATRVQYSGVSVQVSFDKKREKINTEIYAVMDGNRYSKKEYEQKTRDCNQVRNLILYRKHGYKFFTQKRDPALSKSLMEDIFKNVFFENISFNDEEIKFIIEKMFIKVIVYHPIKKKELTCSGKINDYELK